ncbi:hypothetical protein [Pantoea allii]|uniref:hypothetical protein n=1 Tax=Pantoea allii TaxID=574096 RepID=UPI0024B69C9D|nr:hypothetical protein [Pantoea allii]MDJ0040639.1 hypothetical protein [Pantoea allii]
MSYEFKLASSISSKELFEHINFVLESSIDLDKNFTNDNSVAYKYKNSESGWDADVELCYENSNVFLNVHAGNAKKIINSIRVHLEENNTSLTIEEE